VSWNQFLSCDGYSFGPFQHARRINQQYPESSLLSPSKTDVSSYLSMNIIPFSSRSSERRLARNSSMSR
jgi:hypothetical protein